MSYILSFLPILDTLTWENRADLNRGIPFPLQDQSAKPRVRQSSTPASPKTVAHHGKQGHQEQAQKSEPSQQGKQVQHGGQCSLEGSQKQQQQQPEGKSGYWYEHIKHEGQSSFLQAQYKDTYKVFRNVVSDYGADNTGSRDASEAIQKAIEGK